MTDLIVDPPTLIIACSGAKRAVPEGERVRAATLYTGTFFRKLTQWAAEHNVPVLILSAKFGLVKPRDLLPWYEQRITPATARVLREAIPLDAWPTCGWMQVGRDYLRLVPPERWLVPLLPRSLRQGELMQAVNTLLAFPQHALPAPGLVFPTWPNVPPMHQREGTLPSGWRALAGVKR